MAPANRKMISIAALDKRATLSKAQKTFNRLIEQIDQRRTQMFGATGAPIDADLKAIYKRHSRSDFDGDIARLHALLDLVADLVGYESGHTHSGTTAEEALEAGHGVCQDQAHAFISAARLMGFPARYVSGYLMMEERVEQEGSHAWAEAYVDGLGWVGFDAANRMSPDDRYLRVATGLDYKEAAPISGMRLGDSGEAMFVSLQVQQ